MNADGETPPANNRPAATGAAKALFAAMRPRQWYKNLVIYVAFFFTVNEAWDFAAPDAAFVIFAKMTAAAALFSALSGAVYIYNDILDADRDRRHPQKRHRPIASGRLPVAAAWPAAAVLAAAGVGGAFALEPAFGVIAAAYAAIQIAYSLFLKRAALVDVFVISLGMAMRAAAGAAVMQAPISPWLYLCAALAALVLALVKRRSELQRSVVGGDAATQRDSLGEYTVATLDRLITIAAAAALIAYSLYTFTAPNLPDNNAMMLTIPFVAFGVFRYIFLTDKSQAGESPEDLLFSDRPLVAALLLWLLSAAAILTLFGR